MMDVLSNPRCGFLKIITVGNPTYAGVKTGLSRADVGMEASFHAGA